MENILSETIYTHRYSSEDLIAVQVNDFYNTETIKQLLKRYYTYGFVIFDFGDNEVDQETLQDLVNYLGLGDAYIPSVYANYKSLKSDHGFNILNQKYDDNSHRAFNTSLEQEIHSDGTLEKIGFIKTTLLYCKAQGISGGESTLFNSVGAYFNLIKTNFEISKLLLDENCLRRVSNINYQEYIGPAFAIQENKLISRFSLDNTCDWNHGFEKLPGLEKAFTLLTEQVNDQSPYFITCKLKPGQGMLIANNKISHGRKSFKDSKECRREMIRGLFTKAPM